VNGLAEDDGIPDYGYNYPEVTLWYGSKSANPVVWIFIIYHLNENVSYYGYNYPELMSDYPSEVNLEDQYF
jgi:hypothetical protein